MKCFTPTHAAAAALFLLPATVLAQTYTACNPLTATCPADTALGKSINVDFTKGAVDSFHASGTPTYNSEGVSFTVAKSGDSPQLTSLFYIMFGKVEVTMKAAPGVGIVSSLVLQSDDLDEIDMEWIGADASHVQTNYFGKGNTATYDRGAFNPAANNQNTFITYTIEWTESQISWSVGGTVVRVLTPTTAETNQYPQTPMQVKFGAWSGGDPSNSAGTIAWAGGNTNYAAGPFTMLVQSIAVADYSTGTSYSYSGSSGTWESIVVNGGTLNANAGAQASSVVTVAASSNTVSPSVPAGIGGSETMTGWPWVTTGVPTTLETQTSTSIAGIPSGWTVSGSGKIVPASSAVPTSFPVSTSSVAQSPSPSSAPSPVLGGEITTGWDEQGFPTTYTLPAGYSTMVKSYDNQGFLITPAPTPAPTPAATTATTLATAALVLEAESAALTTSTITSVKYTASGLKIEPVWWKIFGLVAGMGFLL